MIIEEILMVFYVVCEKLPGVQWDVLVATDNVLEDL